MKDIKYHIYLNSEERRLLIGSLNDLRNKLIAEGRYTDLVDEVLIKAANAKIKKNQGGQQMPAIGIFASFEGGNDNTLTPLNSLLQNRINIDFLKLTFSTIMEDKDYDK